MAIPFALTLKDGTIINNGGDLQELVGKRADLLQKTPINSTEYEGVKKSYNIMAKLYNDKVMDVWHVYN